MVLVVSGGSGENVTESNTLYSGVYISRSCLSWTSGFYGGGGGGGAFGLYLILLPEQ